MDADIEEALDGVLLSALLLLLLRQSPRDDFIDG
jgi:hypothetical protein